MHEAALAQAALPAPTVVLGLLLRPYSLGHELFLIREGNLLVEEISKSEPDWPTKIKTPTRQDLLQAALICCQSFRECTRMHADWLMGLKLWLWKRRVSARGLQDPKSFQGELLKFVEYRAAGKLEFRLSDNVRPGSGTAPRMPGAPFLIRLQQFVVMRLGKSEEEAWDYPFGLAKMQWAAFWETEGGLDIYNKHDAEHDAFVAKMEAEEKSRVLSAQSKAGEVPGA